MCCLCGRIPLSLSSPAFLSKRILLVLTKYWYLPKGCSSLWWVTSGQSDLNYKLNCIQISCSKSKVASQTNGQNCLLTWRCYRLGKQIMLSQMHLKFKVIQVDTLNCWCLQMNFFHKDSSRLHGAYDQGFIYLTDN